MLERILNHFGYRKCRPDIPVELLRASNRVINVCYGENGSWQGYVNLERRYLLEAMSDLWFALREAEKHYGLP